MSASLLAALLAACLAAPPPAAAADKKKAKSAKAETEPGVEPASSDTVKMVKYFVDSEIADLPPERIPQFIAIRGETLPKKLRDPFTARRAELLSLKQMADTRSRPPIRRLNQPQLSDSSCESPREMSNAGMLGKMGFFEIDEREENQLMRETKCTECELQKEFSLTIIVITPPKGSEEKSRRRYFLNDADPLTAVVQAWRNGRQGLGGTNFFSMGHSACR
ncbi:MAG: hypothetical protein HY078_06990 [Elusimicrobia bacterium]|nr:hypothetical protein [Elusimicrobiota bacterium]